MPLVLIKRASAINNTFHTNYFFFFAATLFTRYIGKILSRYIYEQFCKNGEKIRIVATFCAVGV